MNEPKPFASLSSGLLARKGAARPAMRPQSFRFANEGAGLAMANPSLDDLGWNDMGDDIVSDIPVSTVPAQTPPVARLVVPPRVVAQQAELAKRFDARNEEMPVAVDPMTLAGREALAPSPGAKDAETHGESRSTRAVAGSKAKAAFTLRLDPDRHLRLRLICAVKHKSAQQIVTQALDEFLARHPENSRLATHG